MKTYINKLFEITPGRYLPCGLDFMERLWWRFMPGEIFTVRWPRGPLVVDHNDPRWVDLGGAVLVSIDSADPNDHYRLDLERLVGRQGWDWNWGMAGNNIAEDRLTIKIRRKHAKWASYFALKWG